ncbi:glycosyltransferase family 4 protein [Psychrobacillus sp. NPDC093200]|uniref:glycosyltransferase family 4 protein n=1 Tax=Psychrobacillus sp. NPDC093200 TaxID=3390656 RepID=UPI0012AF57E1|nr:glycosyltransferase [Bacillus sp. N3536]
MKVLHINSYYGGGMLYKNIYDRQVRNGIPIDVYVPTPFTTDLSHLQLGEYTTVRKNHYKFDRYLFYVKHKKIYKDLVKNFNVQDYSLVHAHTLFSNGYIALQTKKKFGIPYVVAVRNTDVNQFFKRRVFLRSLGIEILKEAESIIFLSDSYKNIVVETYVAEKDKKEILEKSIIIPNGIDEFWFNNLGNPKTLSQPKSINIIFIGAVNNNKNILTSARALEMLQGRGYKVKFTVVGKISNEQVYEELMKFSFVNYLKPQSKESLLEIYRSHDIFVMPSLTETFGLVYPEAMSQGLPLIYSKGQGFDGQFEEGKVGYHVDSLDPTMIADRIIDIMKNYEDISKNCLALVDNFNWDRLLTQYDDVYARALQNESKR